MKTSREKLPLAISNQIFQHTKQRLKQKLDPQKIKKLQDNFNTLKQKIKSVQINNFIVLNSIKQKINQNVYHSSILYSTSDQNLFIDQTFNNKCHPNISPSIYHNHHQSFYQPMHPNMLSKKQKLQRNIKQINNKLIKRLSNNKKNSKEQSNHIYQSPHKKIKNAELPSYSYKKSSTAPKSKQIQSKSIQNNGGDNYHHKSNPYQCQSFSANTQRKRVNSTSTKYQNGNAINKQRQADKSNPQRQICKMLKIMQNITLAELGSINQNINQLNHKIQSLDFKTKQLARILKQSNNTKKNEQFYNKVLQKVSKLTQQNNATSKLLLSKNKQILQKSELIKEITNKINGSQKDSLQKALKIQQLMQIIQQKSKYHQEIINQIKKQYEEQMNKLRSINQKLTKDNSVQTQQQICEQQQQQKQKQQYHQQQQLFQLLNKIEQQNRVQYQKQKENLAKKYEQIVQNLTKQLNYYIQKYNVVKTQVNKLQTKIEERQKNPNVTQLQQKISYLQQQLACYRQSSTNNEKLQQNDKITQHQHKQQHITKTPQQSTKMKQTQQTQYQKTNKQRIAQQNINTLKKQNQVLSLKYKRIQMELSLQIGKKDKFIKQIQKNNQLLSNKIKQNEQYLHQIYFKNVRIEQLENGDNPSDYDFQSSPQNSKYSQILVKSKKLIQQKQQQLKQYIAKYNKIQEQLQQKQKIKAAQINSIQTNYKEIINKLKQQIKYLQKQLQSIKKLSLNQSSNQPLSQKILQQIVQQSGNNSQVQNDHTKYLEDEGIMEKRIYSKQIEDQIKTINNQPSINQTNAAKTKNLLLQGIDFDDDIEPVESPKQVPLIKITKQITINKNAKQSNQTSNMKYQKMIKERDRQLNYFIQKHNRQKQQLTNQLDDKSDQITNTKQKMNKVIQQLNSQNLSKSKKIISIKQQLQLKYSQIQILKRENQKIKYKFITKTKQMDKLYIQLVQQKNKVYQFQQQSNFHLEHLKKQLTNKLTNQQIYTTQLTNKYHQQKLTLQKKIQQLRNIVLAKQSAINELQLLLSKQSTCRENTKLIVQQKQQQIIQLKKYVKKKQGQIGKLSGTEKRQIQQWEKVKGNVKQSIVLVDSEQSKYIGYADKSANDKEKKQSAEMDKLNAQSNIIFNSNNDRQAYPRLINSLQIEHPINNPQLINYHLSKYQSSSDYYYQQNIKLNKRIKQANQKMIHFLEQKQIQQQKHQKQFIHQSQIYKKQLSQQKQRYTNLNLTLSSIKKLFQHLIQKILSNQIQPQDIEDCLNSYQKICNINLSKQVQLLSQYKIKHKTTKQQKKYTHLKKSSFLQQQRQKKPKGAQKKQKIAKESI